MNNKLRLPLVMALALATLSSCSKKMDEMKSEYFNSNPLPLVAVGGQVPATINGTFPVKYFDKKSVVTVTPVIVYEGGETKGTPFTYQGEKVTGNDLAISYKMGGNVVMKTSFAYQPEFRQSELYLAFDVERKGKTYTLPRIKVADGVISTSTLTSVKVEDGKVVKSDKVEGTDAALAPDKFQRVITDNYVAKVLFLIQQSELRNKELKSDAMNAVNEAMKTANVTENQRIAGVNVASTASPDGAYDLNEGLAQSREKRTVKHMENVLKRGKMSADITAEFTAEDWAGFQELVEASNIQDKALILRVLSMYKDPSQRENEIKNLSSAFTQLAEEILPQLRYSKVTAAIETIGKSDEEIAALASSNAKELNVEELLYAAAIAKTDAEKVVIYKKATEIYSNDFRAYNNLGKIYLSEGKVAEATSLIEKAAKIAPNAPEVNMNQGLLALAKGDYTSAEAAFGKAAGVPELNGALGALYIERGEYDKAVAAFGNTKTNTAAVAQLCAGDASRAKTTLSSIEEKDAMTYYLMAVVGARTNNESMVASNLAKSVSMNNAMAVLAKSDAEFANYDVASIIK